MNVCRSLLLASMFAGALVSSSAQQSTSPASASSEPQAAASASTPAAPMSAEARKQAASVVRDRANQFYAALLKGDRTGAAKYVSPDSVQQYDAADLKTLNSARVESVTVGEDGVATVAVTRSFAPPVSMALPWTDHWTQVNGVWYLTFPKPTYETPFGVMKPGTPLPNEKEVEAQIMRRENRVDSDVALRQLSKAMKEEEDKKEAADKAKAEQAAQQDAKKGSSKKSKKKVKNAASTNSAQNSAAPPASAPPVVKQP